MNTTMTTAKPDMTTAKPDMIETPAYTYMREPLAADRVGQCPCCLAEHRTSIKGGRLARHGWKESGRRVGSFGLGFQWGSCVASGMAPLQQTDRDARIVLVRLEAHLVELEERLAMQRSVGDETYAHEIKVDVRTWQRSKSEEVADQVQEIVAKALASRGLEGTPKIVNSGRGYHLDYSVQAMVSQKRGAPAVTLPASEVYMLDPSRSGGGWDVKIPSWETLRQEVVKSLEATRAALLKQRLAIRAAVAHHLANPSTGKPKTKGTVHLFRRWTVTSVYGANSGKAQERTGLACSVRSGSSGKRSTENTAEVTCARCLKAMAKAATGKK